MGVGWSDDPDLAGLGQRFRDELRAEAAEYELLAARDLLRNRGLGEVALELLVRGDLVSASVGAQRFSGTVVHAAGDLAVLRTAAGDVDLNLAAPLALHVEERVPSGGLPRGRGASSFTARLAEHEASGLVVTLGCPALAGDARGRIEAVAPDHVVLDVDGSTVYLVKAAIAWVRVEG